MSKTHVWPHLLTFLVFGLALLPAHAQSADTLTVIAQRINQTTLAPDKPPQADQITRLVATLPPSGRWPDINYADQGHSLWLPNEHLQRLLLMARAYRLNPDNPQNPALKDAILRGYDAWFVNRPTSPNWWWMPEGIGTHLTLAPLMLLMQPELSQAQRSTGVAELKQAWLGIGTNKFINEGQNLVWRGRITLMRAALTHDLPLAQEALRGVTSVVAVTPKEGVQADGSFHQHGPQLYSGGYGEDFTEQIGDIAALTQRTSLALTPTQADTLAHYVLDGQQWMVRGHFFDYSVAGREITRKGKDAKGLQGPVANLALLNSPRTAEFAAFAQRMTDGPSAANPYPHGSRAFWRSDYIVQENAQYLTSVRLSSLRTRSTELVNGEGLLSHYLGDGANLLYRRGDEYADIFPVWDWTRIPGVTCALAPTPPPMLNHVAYRGTTDFAGSVSDGSAGVAALDYMRGGVTAHKAWFLFDGITVCLGAGITAPAGSNPIVTSVNQCLLSGPVSVSSGTNAAVMEPAPGQHALSAAHWVYHDGVGYLFPGPQARVVLQNQAQTGKWTLINTARSDAPVTHDVFSLWLAHGVHPQNAAYVYMTVPGIALAALPQYAAHPPVRVVQNTPACQAVWQDNEQRGGIAFFAAGTCTVQPGLRVAVNAPCLLLLRKQSRKIIVCASDPTQKLTSLQVDISAPLTGDGAVWLPGQKAARLSITLPTGQQAGQSVVCPLVLAGDTP